MKRERIKNFKPQNSFLLCFTALFAAVALAVFLPFVIFKTSLVWENEGLSQYYMALIYWGKYLREIAKNLLAGQLVIPQYDFSIGLGEDVFTTLNLYVLGDPFALLSAGVPSRFEPYFVSLLAVVRLYFAGLAFGLLARERKIRAPYAALGALVYAFCGYALTNGINMQYCINPLIYFPLLVFGSERILSGKRPYVFIISVILAAVGNVYFFLQLSVFTLLFIVMHLKYAEKGAEITAPALKLLLYYFIGVLCGAVVLLPALSAAANSFGGFGGSSLYSLDYYKALLPNFLSGAFSAEGGLSLGFTAAGAFGIILLLSSKKKNCFYREAFIGMCLFVLLPIFGRLLGATGETQNNWVWALALLVAFVLASELQSAEKISLRASLIALAFAGALGIFCLAVKELRTEEYFAQLILLAAFAGAAIIFAVYSKNSAADKSKAARLFKLLLAVLCVISVCTNGLYRFAYTESSNASSSRAAVQSNASFTYARELSGANSWKCVRELQDTASAVERYDVALLDARDYNNAIINEALGTTEYFGFENSYLKLLQSEAQTSRSVNGAIEPAYGDPYLEAIENVRYFACTDKRLLPAGYSEERLARAEATDVRKTDKTYFAFYENENYIPFGYMYKNVLSQADYDALSPADKRLALSKALVLNDCADGYANTSASAVAENSSSLGFELSAESGAVIDGGVIHVYEKNAKLVLKTNAPANDQLYLQLEGAEFSPLSKARAVKKYNPDMLKGLTKSAASELLFESKSSAKAAESKIEVNVGGRLNMLLLASPRNNNYSGAQSFTVNLGSYEAPVVEILLYLGAIGDYSFEDISLVAHSADNLSADLAALSETAAENLKFETDKFSGSINSAEGGWLYFSLPYSENWKAYVDGKPVELFRANTAFTAINIEAGEHGFEFKYSNPLLISGAYISLLGFGLLSGATVAVELSARRRRAKNEK